MNTATACEKYPCRICSNFSVRPSLHALVHGTRTCAQLHGHVRRTLVPPSAVSGLILGLRAACCEYVRVSTPSAPAHAMTARALPPMVQVYIASGRAVAAPGRREDVISAPNVERRIHSRNFVTPRAMYCGAHARLCQKVQGGSVVSGAYVHMDRDPYGELCVSVLCCPSLKK